MKSCRYTREEAKSLIGRMCNYLVLINGRNENITAHELCRQFSISTSTFYRWLHMYVEALSPDKYGEIRSILHKNTVLAKKTSIVKFKEMQSASQQNNIDGSQEIMTKKEKFLVQIYNLFIKEELDQEKIQQFCDMYQITLKEAVQYYQLYLKKYATEAQYNEAKRASYLRQYEKIIFSIMKEESIEKKKAMLMEHRELYSLKAHVFVTKHPECAKEIKGLTILYQQAISEVRNKTLQLLYSKKNRSK